MKNFTYLVLINFIDKNFNCVILIKTNKEVQKTMRLGKKFIDNDLLLIERFGEVSVHQDISKLLQALPFEKLETRINYPQYECTTIGKHNEKAGIFRIISNKDSLKIIFETSSKDRGYYGEYLTLYNIGETTKEMTKSSSPTLFAEYRKVQQKNENQSWEQTIDLHLVTLTETEKISASKKSKTYAVDTTIHTEIRGMERNIYTDTSTDASMEIAVTNAPR